MKVAARGLFAMVLLSLLASGGRLVAAWRLNLAHVAYAKAIMRGDGDRAPAHERLERAFQAAAARDPLVGSRLAPRVLAVLRTGTGAPLPAICPPAADADLFMRVLLDARAQHAAGDLERAGALFDWLAQSCPRSFETLVDWAALERRLAHYETAKALLERALTLEPAIAPLGLIDKSPELWRRVLLAGAYSDLAGVLEKQNNLEGAVRAAEQARTLQPPGLASPWLYNLLGIIYDRLGRPADARQAFGQALRLKPDIPEARDYLNR